ncbi:hypothetical protein HWA94_gp14 [Pseudomonas phage ZC08]|uniref:Histone H1 n=1 Tax=Pseudomonas phage ZC08 TaxID=1622116 RepID=A0A1L2C9G0_9CAUD|nr:hypothetical protein HWA94_gp14 [Pseudomonas phage ZC08]AMD43542.1 hypothetical protein ZC08_014 [Pseudomonas phage ZC08]
MTQFQQLLDTVTEFKDELSQYLEKGATNASQAKRLRKASVQLGKDLKQFRTDSVAHHRKD